MAIAEIIGLALYALQQGGVALGVGGETVALLTRHNPLLASAARKTAFLGLWFIIISGLLITAAHLVAGEGAIVTEPAYLFKWALIAVLLIGGFLTRGTSNVILVGGTWYALFFLHTFAPVISFFLLVALYAGWMAVFSLFSFLLARPTSSATKHEEPVFEAPPPSPPPPPRPAPAPRMAQPVPPPPPMRVAEPPQPPPPPMRMAPPPPPPPVRVAPPPPPPPVMRPAPVMAFKPAPLPPIAPRPAPPPPLRETPAAARLGIMVPPPPPKASQGTAPPANLPGVPIPKKDGISPTALQSIPTVLPDKNPKPLSGVTVMPRSPNDLNK